MDAVLRALADPSRRQLLDRLRQRNGLTLTELCRGFSQSRQAVTKHLAILKKANLVLPLWRGRLKLHYLNPTPICQLDHAWLHSFDRVRVKALVELKQALEQHRPK